MKLSRIVNEIKDALRSNPKLITLLVILFNLTAIGAAVAATAGESATAAGPGQEWAYLGAAIAVAGSGVAAAVAIYGAATAGFAATVERPELAVWALIFGGLAEGVAIYGFVIAIMILGKV